MTDIEISKRNPMQKFTVPAITRSPRAPLLINPSNIEEQKAAIEKLRSSKIILGGPQTDLLNSYIVQNTGNITINNMTITNNEALIAELTSQNTALSNANSTLTADNGILDEIIAELIDPVQIGYLTVVQGENDAAIAANDTKIAANDVLISSLNGQNTALTTTNATLAANNVILAAIIIEVTPN